MRLGVKNLFKKLCEPVRDSFEASTEACTGVEDCIENWSKDTSQYRNTAQRGALRREDAVCIAGAQSPRGHIWAA